MVMTLQQVLNKCYKLDVIDGHKNLALNIINDNKTTTNIDAARELLPSYEAASNQCFISRKNAEYLQAMLAN